jgi:branched-chain amino acid transport system permease protein
VRPSARGQQIASRGGVALLVAAGLVALASPALFGQGGLSLAYIVLYYLCLTAAWNLFSGFSGYINFGFVAFIGIGMYGSAVAIADYQIAWPVAYLIGGVAAALFAAAIGIPLLRTRGAYFSIAMLAIAEGMRVLSGTEYLEPLTRGGKGLPVTAGSLEYKYYAMCVLAAAMLVLSWRIARSRFGLALIAVREDETAADGLGLDTTRVKFLAFVLSAFFAGVAGGVHATFLHYIDPPAAFDIRYTTMPIVMAIFGGMGTVVGPVIGAVGLAIVNDLTWLHLGRLNLTIFGIILIVLIFWLPDGVAVRLKESGWLGKSRSI